MSNRNNYLKLLAEAKRGYELAGDALGLPDIKSLQVEGNWSKFAYNYIQAARNCDNLKSLWFAKTEHEKRRARDVAFRNWQHFETLLSNSDLPATESTPKSYVDASLAKRVLRLLAPHVINKRHRISRFFHLRSEATVCAADEISLYENLLSEGDLRSVLLALADIALEQGDTEKTIEYANRALRLNAVCPDSQNLLYRALKQRGENADPRPAEDIFLANISDRFCARPFTTLVTGYAGKSFLCDCPAYLPFPSGNVLNGEDADAVWNSDEAQEIRRSILDGDFTYCSRSLCGLIREDLLPRKDEVTDKRLRAIIDGHQTKLDFGPQTVQLSHDQSCNLACPSCRTDIMTLKASEQEPYMASLDRVLLPLLEKTDGTVMVSGGGDPFGSKFYRTVLESLNPDRFPDLDIAILTNALLLTPKQWAKFHRAHPMIDSLMVSVDAARPETYADVRRPGDFNKLLPNLEFLAERRAAEDIHFFGLCFVVQQKNFREMPEFVQLGRRLGADLIWFQRIVNFGSFTSEEIRSADVVLPDHPDHNEFQTILRNPAMKDPSVKLFGEFVSSRSQNPDDVAQYHEKLRKLRVLRNEAMSTGNYDSYEEHLATMQIEAMGARPGVEFRLGG